MAGLLERVQDLPPEIFYEIKDLVLTISSARVVIDEDYKPPNQLQVNIQTRLHLTEKFYNKTIFEFGQTNVCCKWLRSLSIDNFDMITELELRFLTQQHSDGSSTEAEQESIHKPERGLRRALLRVQIDATHIHYKYGALDSVEDAMLVMDACREVRKVGKWARRWWNYASLDPTERGGLGHLTFAPQAV